MSDENPWADPATRADYEAARGRFHRDRAALLRSISTATFHAAAKLDVHASLRHDIPDADEVVGAAGVAVGVLELLAVEEDDLAFAAFERERVEIRRAMGGGS